MSAEGWAVVLGLGFFVFLTFLAERAHENTTESIRDLAISSAHLGYEYRDKGKSLEELNEVLKERMP